MRKAFVVLNPVAGQSEPEELEELITEYAKENGWDCRLHHTEEEEPLDVVIDRARAEGFELFVAGGGDGTVSAVAGALAGTGVAMAILPVGTGNVLARDLEIPLEAEEALEVAFGQHNLLALDGLQANDRLFLLNVSAGPIAGTMRDVSSDEKRRFGFLAYLAEGVSKFLGHNRQRFRVIVDGQEHRLVASEAVVLNSPAFGSPNVALDPEVRIDDGRVEVYLLRVKTLGDYVRLAWNALVAPDTKSPLFHRFVARETVLIAPEPPLPVQGDGDYIGQSPIEMRVLPGAVKVAVPIPEEDGQGNEGE
ncbi:MAG TPA: diacylglycerol kinase family protein [Anaerolineae bacterium]|nr:diacylglycerol kinase family protein [Anaerolineae bacterium]